MILDDILKILKKKSQRKAYTIGKISYTYKELYKYTCNIYNYLLNENKAKKPVIVYGHKQIYMKASFLACAFAGITYVPIDENMPKERIERIVAQVEPGLIIGNIQTNYKSINKNKIYEVMNNENYKEISKIFLKENDIFYIIFTSGSTGTPKGVNVSYRNMDSCVKWLKDITREKNGVVLNQANFSFDLSVADLYLSLVTESEHFILETGNKMDLKKIFEQLKKSNATLAVMTPSFADLLLLDKSFTQDLIPTLRKIIFCGEKLQLKTVEKLYKKFDNLKIINCYGPTECTFAVTSIEIPRSIKEEIPVGISKSDVEIFIVDDNLDRLSDCKVGEILIVGESVAKGYLKEQEKRGFIEYNNKKAYLTGDLGYMQNGVLYYKDRCDKQIKYKGYRIELSDIERNLQAINIVERSIVLTKKNKEGKILNMIAFIKLNSDKYNCEDVKKQLQKKLPEYMIPRIKVVDKFPINNNGKCDEKKLLEEY